MSPADAFEDRMRDLRRAFVSALPDRLARLQALFAEPPVVSIDDARSSLRQEAHRLAGSGTSYGLPELSDWGRHTEALCRRGASADELVKQVEALAELIAGVEQAGPETAVG